jgi:hypothetical protein
MDSMIWIFRTGGFSTDLTHQFEFEFALDLMLDGLQRLRGTV